MTTTDVPRHCPVLASPGQDHSGLGTPELETAHSWLKLSGSHLEAITTLQQFGRTSRNCPVLPGFPGGSVAKNLPCQCRRLGFDPWFRKILHAMRQLSPCTTTIAPQQEKSPQLENARLNERKVHVAMESQHSQKETNKF